MGGIAKGWHTEEQRRGEDGQPWLDAAFLLDVDGSCHGLLHGESPGKRSITPLNYSPFAQHVDGHASETPRIVQALRDIRHVILTCSYGWPLSANNCCGAIVLRCRRISGL